MSDIVKPVLAAAFGGFVIATAAGAQTTVFTGTNQVDDRIEDLEEDIEEDFERDVDAFGTEGRELGFDGSMALRGSATSGNTDTVDLGIGANFGYFTGLNAYELQLSYDYSEDEDETTEESLLYELEYRRSFTPEFYGFAELQGTVDEFSNYESDTFVGFGVGYRIVNTSEMVWAVQAGPGYRIADLEDLNQVDDFEEAALSISSEFYREMNEDVFFTNDTDIITSDSDTVVLNDLGVTVSMNDQLALRTSLLTEYHTEPFAGADDTDNRLGVSLVYSFD